MSAKTARAARAKTPIDEAIDENEAKETHQIRETKKDAPTADRPQKHDSFGRFAFIIWGIPILFVVFMTVMSSDCIR